MVRRGSGFRAAPLAHEIEAASKALQTAGGQAIYFLFPGNRRGLDVQARYIQRLEAGGIACLPRKVERIRARETPARKERSSRSAASIA